MLTDLFLSKEQALLNWCKSKGLFSKADIMRYGLDNFYIRADRTVRDFVKDGKIEKLPTEKCLFMGLTTKMAWYKVK